jgi:hypothetical protein
LSLSLCLGNFLLSICFLSLFGNSGQFFRFLREFLFCFNKFLNLLLKVLKHFLTPMHERACMQKHHFFNYDARLEGFVSFFLSFSFLPCLFISTVHVKGKTNELRPKISSLGSKLVKPTKSFTDVGCLGNSRLACLHLKVSFALLFLNCLGLSHSF